MKEKAKAIQNYLEWIESDSKHRPQLFAYLPESIRNSMEIEHHRRNTEKTISYLIEL